MAGTGRISLSCSAVGDVKSTHQYNVTANLKSDLTTAVITIMRVRGQ